MAGPLYPNQPLIEVTTEVRFSGNLEVDLIRPDFQKAIQSDYPNLMVQGAKEGVSPSLQHIRFENVEGIAGVQLAMNSFSFYTRQYPGHESFLKEAHSTLGSFLQLIKSIQVTRIGWRYINVIPFTRENGSLPLKRYFSENGHLGGTLNTDYSNVNFSALKAIGGKQLNIRLETALTNSEPVVEALLLDIDVFDLIDPPTSSNDVSVAGGITSVHGAACDVFENTISDDYRVYLKGNDHA